MNSKHHTAAKVMKDQSKSRRVGLAVYLGLIILTAVCFWQVRNFDFVNYDDHLYVYANPHVLNGITTDGIIWAFTSGHASNWHPLTWLSLMLDCQLFGPEPGSMHLVNLLLHLANTLLIFTVLRKKSESVWPSAFVAALFAIHPAHVESVAWVAERKDVLSTFFFMLILLAYVAYVRRPGIFRYLIILAVFAMGLLAKPMLVTLPFLLLLLDYWPLKRFQVSPKLKTFSWQRAIIEKIPFFVLAIISSAVTFLVQRSGGAVVERIEFDYRAANAIVSYGKYVLEVFWPVNLAVFYPFEENGLPPWQIAVAAAFLFSITVWVIALARKQKYLFVGWFWFIGTLVPVIGLVQVGSQAMADRYTYIPYIGLFIMIAWGARELFSKLPQQKILLGISAIIALTALGICGIGRQAIGTIPTPFFCMLSM